MSIPYSYEIVAVNEAAKCMEVVYSSEGRQTMHISARLPYLGETIEAVVQMYAPVRYWEEQEAAVVVPQIGLGGQVTPPAPQPLTPDQIKAIIVQAAQERLDAFARTRNYDGILSACTYASDPDPVFAAEGQWCIAKRGATWATLYSILTEGQAGTRPIPTGFADIEAELPDLSWPVT